MCSELWIGQVELDWCINSSFMTHDFGAVSHQTYWVWQFSSGVIVITDLSENFTLAYDSVLHTENLFH